MVVNNNRRVELKSAICLLTLVCCIMLQAEVSGFNLTFLCKDPLIELIN